MSTLIEIEQAIATLPASAQRDLYRHLGARLGHGAASAAADKREAVAHFLHRWTGAGTAPVTEGELCAQRTTRLVEKQVK
jgi:DNA integrity scanning protein DisA with diadenylate cyclase activity